MKSEPVVHLEDAAFALLAATVVLGVLAAAALLGSLP
jgi:hypothetical protein